MPEASLMKQYGFRCLLRLCNPGNSRNTRPWIWVDSIARRGILCARSLHGHEDQKREVRNALSDFGGFMFEKEDGRDPNGFHQVTEIPMGFTLVLFPKSRGTTAFDWRWKLFAPRAGFYKVCSRLYHIIYKRESGFQQCAHSHPIIFMKLGYRSLERLEHPPLSLWVVGK